MDSNKLKLYFEKFDFLDYVIAYGSIGRGEAPLVKDELGNDILYNDLDLILVTEQKGKAISIASEIKEEIKRLFGVKWVDLLIWDSKQLQKKRKTVFYFDLCFKRLVIKGDPRKLSLILKPISQRSISTYDFYCMYQTRMWAVMSLQLKVDDRSEFGNQRFKSYQCAKAIIAVCDFILFSQNKYSPIVSEKDISVVEFKDSRIETFLLAHLGAAIEIKRKPDSSALLYFIEDESLVSELQSVFQSAFQVLLESRHSFPKISKGLAETRMNIMFFARAIQLRDKSLLDRNCKRKKLSRLLENNNQQTEYKHLSVLLKDLSE